MSSSKRRSGVAIVTSLVILVAVFAVGIGAVFLAQMTLGVSINVRSNTIAQANADAGIEATILALEAAYFADGAFPQSAPATSVSGVSFTPTYTATVTTTADRATVRVVGTGPSNAEHIAEAAVLVVPGEPRLPPAWEYGLASEASCRTTGQSTFLNAGIHCNAGFDLGNDTYGFCTARDADGRCTAFTTIPVADAPVSASPGATLCSPNQLCNGGVPKTLVEPIVITPGYLQKRDTALAAASDVGGTPWVATADITIGCTRILSNPSAADLRDALEDTGATVCVDSAMPITIPAMVVEDVRLIARGNVTLARDATINESLIVSLTGSVEAASNGNANVTVHQSEVFSQGNVRMNGNQTSISGMTTIASAGNVTLNGGAPATTSPDGEIGIGLVVVAEGNIEVNGNSDWFVAAIAGGTFTQNGTSTLHGNVAGKGVLRFNGGVDLDSGLRVLNEGGNEPGEPRVEVFSRR